VSGDYRVCGARKKNGEGDCRRPAGWGTDHAGEGPCKLHGGSTPTVARGAHLRLVERQARELFGKAVPDARPVENPLAEYALFAGRVMAWLDLCDSLLDEVRAVESHRDSPEVGARIALYERAVAQANTTLRDYARLNIDARLSAITESQVNRILRAVDAVITLLANTPTQAANARALAIRHLEAVDTG
jgi:hypothetical protein